MKSIYGLAGLGALLLAGVAHAQQPQPIMVPAILPTDVLCRDLPNGTATPQEHCYTGAQLSNFAASSAGGNGTNDIIGGDFGTNLFQDGTTVSSITTTPTYVADQWSAFSGTSTTLAGAQETGAGDITPGYTASLRITRSGAGILQSCVATEIPSANVVRYQGQTAEFDFHALAGSGFSAAGSNLNVLIVTSTDTNPTMANLAKTINSALSGTAWGGAATSTIAVPISATWGRYTVAAPIPATTTAMGIAICYTPVGGSPSSDYFEFTGAQLVPNSALTTIAGTAGALLNPSQAGMAKSFYRRPQQLETDLQLAFYWRQNESTANIYGVCQETSSTNAFCFMQFPVPMFKVPTLSFTAGGISATLGTSQANVAITGLAITSSGATTTGSQLTATAASGLTALTGFLKGTSTTGTVIFNARF